MELEPGAALRISDLENPVELGLAMKGLLEEEDLRLFLSLMEAAMTSLDIGANAGMFSLLIGGSTDWIEVARIPAPEHRIWSNHWYRW